eukprot:g10320.t1
MEFPVPQDPRVAKLLKRTLARVRGESTGFDDAEKEDLHAAFLRFKVPDSADIHKDCCENEHAGDDLDALLNFVGRWVPPDEAISELARKITMYDYMDFDEFLTFMTYYDEFERAEQERIFKLYDEDSSGNISARGPICLRRIAMVKKKKLNGGENGDDYKRVDTTTSPVNADNFGLATLLSPVTVDKFHEGFFERHALHVARPSCPGYYAPLEDLSSPQRLFKLMEDGTETPPTPTRVDEVVRLFNEGWSIQWLQPQHEHDALSTLVATLESQFGCLVGVNAYLTPAGAQGLAPHWDDVDVFVLQLGGSKAWSLHRCCTDSPLEPEQQTLPRYSSGDLAPESLSDAFMRPKLLPGDLLYFPRGIIHHAPNKDSRMMLTFEEAMSELWEEDEELRKALPWKALTLAPPNKLLSSAVAQQLRRLADAVEAESSEDTPGAVAAALGELGAEFVRHRMPPRQKEEVEVSLVGLRSTVRLDISAIALLPVPGDIDDAAARLIHCASNMRKNHMMNHPAGADAGHCFPGNAEEAEPEEAEEEDLEGDEVLDPADPGQVLSGPVVVALRHICSSEPKTLQELLQEAKVPPERWQEMMHEALGVVDKNWDGELNFEELCCFLAVYRGSEGFTKEEVASLKELFDAEAVEVDNEKPGRHELPPEPKLAGKHLPSLLIQAFGMQVADNVEELQQQLASGQGFRKTATNDSSESGSATISFKEFLILARRTREMEMMQLTKEMPGLLNTPAKAGTGDFSSAVTWSIETGIDLPRPFEVLATKDGNGTISSEELYQFLIGKEFTPLKKVVIEILQETAAEALEHGEGLDFNQFFDFLFVYRQRDGFARAEVDHFRKGFDEYDADGSGSISTLELSDIFRDFGYRISVDTLHHYIDKVDQDGSNQLDFREFLRLMRWHRESELEHYKQIFSRSKVTRDGVEGILRKKLKAAIEELGAVGDVKIIEVEVERLPKEALIDFDVFVDVVDACRLEFVKQEKKKAGFTDEELERYTEAFQKFDRDGSGSIEGRELLKLLEAFKWEPRSKQEREVLMGRLNTARKRAREAEAPKVSKDDSPEFGFWEFIQLARELNTLHEKAKEQAMNQLMEEVQFNQKEVNQLQRRLATGAVPPAGRGIIADPSAWVGVARPRHPAFSALRTFADENQLRKSEQTFQESFAEARLCLDDAREPLDCMLLIDVIERAKQLDESDAGLSRELVRRLVRNTGVSLGPERKEALDARLDILEEEGKLKFHGFLKLMRWILDSDFGEINSHIQQQGDKGKSTSSSGQA